VNHGSRRPSILYVAPGHDFLPSAGPTRNVLNQARAMMEWADITLAFRRLAAPPAASDPPVLEIAPWPSGSPPAEEDAGTTGMSYLGFLTYLRTIRRFVRSLTRPIDVVLEKDWMLTGLVSLEFRKRGIAGAPVKNWIAGVRSGGDGPGLRTARLAFGAWLEGRLLRRIPCVVAETDVLKEAMVRRWRLDPGHVEVIGVGVDRELFRPSDPDEARARLGIARDATVLLYSGILDRTHDVEPLLRAVVRLGDPSIELHLIGDGPRRGELEILAGAGSGSVVFHGRVPHEDVPAYIAAADLCVAPYDPAAFPGGRVAYSTLKIREYLSAGRPVVTVRSGSLERLVQDGRTGFFVANEEGAWYDLLKGRPSRERLRGMGAAAAETELMSWQDVSRAFERLWAERLGANVDGQRGKGENPPVTPAPDGPMRTRSRRR